MSSRRFRKLELGDGPLDPREARAGDADVCRRCGAESRDGEQRCEQCGGVLGGPGQDEFDAAFHARRAAALRDGVRPQPEARPVPVSISGGHAPGSMSSGHAPEEAGYGSVLAATALTACIFALVSIPIRLAFAAAFDGHMPGRAVAELLIVIVLTLVLRRAFARPLRVL